MDKLIFIIDDDPFWTAILTQHLNEMGYANIKTFESGELASAEITSNPDLVFLDFQLGSEDGLDVLQQIKGYNPGIGVIFCTGYEDLGVAISAMEYGSLDYLLKGNASKEVVGKIMASLSRNRAFQAF
ncbi:response regulator [Persicitalea jodogahamensis]